MKLTPRLLSLLATLPTLAVTASATTFYWNGAANTTTALSLVGSYSTDPNTVSAPGAAPGASDDIVFNMNTRNSQNSIANMGANNRAYNSLTFVSSGTTQINRGATDSTTAANSLSLATSFTVEAGAGAVTFGSNQQRAQLRAGGAALSITNNSSSALTFNRNVGSSLASGTSTITVDGSGSGTITFEEQIINNATAGGAIVALTIDRSGSGLVSLNSATASNYSGGFTLTKGNVNANAASALGLGQVSINGGSLTLFGTGAGTINLGANASFNLSGGGMTFDLGTAFDRVVASGTSSLNITGGSISLGVAGAGFSYANTYQLFSGFTSISISSLSLTGYDTGAYTASLDSTGLLSFAAVPEPSSFAALAGLGALGLAASRRRVRR